MSKITKHMYAAGDEAGWLSLRNEMKYRVGGSEIGAIAGHNEYSSFVRLLAERVGAKPVEDISDREPVRAGKDLEWYVAQRFAEVSGKKVHNENCIFTNDDVPCGKATIDRKIAGESSGLECKTAQDLSMRKFKFGDFPQSYFDQCAWYLKITELDRWYLSIYIWGRQLRNFLMTRVKSEADRFAELSAKFRFADKYGTVDAQTAESADYKEWREKWAYLETVYYISDAELDACVTLANRFVNCVREVERFVADEEAKRPFDDAKQRLAFLWNAIYQVIDVNDAVIDGSNSTKETLAESVDAIAMDEVVKDANAADTTEIRDLIVQLNAVNADIDERELQAAELENKIAEKCMTAGVTIIPDVSDATHGYKVTYKLASPRRSVKLDAVETYFGSRNENVPDGMVSVSTPKRSLSVRSWTAKAERKPKTRRNVSASVAS